MIKLVCNYEIHLTCQNKWLLPFFHLHCNPLSAHLGVVRVNELEKNKKSILIQMLRWGEKFAYSIDSNPNLIP